MASEYIWIFAWYIMWNPNIFGYSFVSILWYLFITALWTVSIKILQNYFKLTFVNVPRCCISVHTNKQAVQFSILMDRWKFYIWKKFFLMFASLCVFSFLSSFWLFLFIYFVWSFFFIYFFLITKKCIGSIIYWEKIFLQKPKYFFNWIYWLKL